MRDIIGTRGDISCHDSHQVEAMEVEGVQHQGMQVDAGHQVTELVYLQSVQG